MSIKKIASTFRRHPSDNWLNKTVLENIELIEETKDQKILSKQKRLERSKKNEMLLHEFNSENTDYGTKM